MGGSCTLLVLQTSLVAPLLHAPPLLPCTLLAPPSSPSAAAAAADDHDNDVDGGVDWVGVDYGTSYDACFDPYLPSFLKKKPTTKPKRLNNFSFCLLRDIFRETNFDDESEEWTYTIPLARRNRRRARGQRRRWQGERG